MNRVAWWYAAVLVAAAAQAAEPARPFSESLSPAERERLGLATLTSSQWRELDAAISAYARGTVQDAVQQAVVETERRAETTRAAAEKQAAATAVAEYKQKAEPGVIARTLESFKRRQTEEQRERFTARVIGEFRGWRGGTYFPLENGEIWRQSGTEIRELPPVANAEVEIYKSPNGYWRLKYGNGWITVKRVQ